MADKFMEFINSTEFTQEDLIKSIHEVLPAITPQDLTGKVVIVTGANAGIGFETAKSIASMNPKHLIMACRSIERGQQAAKSVQEATKFAGTLEVMELDLSSFDNVKRFAHAFLAKGLPLDILVNNAGVAMFQWTTTPDGYETHIQVNHLSTMLLTLLLTPALAKAPGGARVEVVASDVHFWAKRPHHEDPTPIKTILQHTDDLFMQQYPNSKLMNVLFAKEYARRCPHKNISICSSNPGYTESELGSKDEKGSKVDHKAPNALPKRPTYEGAKTIIHAAIVPDIENGGFYSDMKPNRVRTTVQGEVGAKFAQNVWKDSLTYLQKPLEGENVEAWATAV